MEALFCSPSRNFIFEKHSLFPIFLAKWGKTRLNLTKNKTYSKLIHESLLIDCSEKTQLERVTNRDGADPKLTKLIIKSQADRNLRIKKADKIILNEGSLEDLSNNIQLFHKDIITKIDNLL